MLIKNDKTIKYKKQTPDTNTYKQIVIIKNPKKTPI